MERPLAGRVGIVTGASSGIGAAVARELAAAGMTVVIGARREDRLAAVVAEIHAAGGAAHALPTDMRDEDAVDRLVDTAARLDGRIDALVNNAAVGYVRTVVDGRSDEWRAIFH